MRQLIDVEAGPQSGNATAYLRAAAHLDQIFRSRTIKELAVHRHRVPPPSFGFDLSQVLRECFAVRQTIALQAWFVVPAIVVAGVLSPSGMLVAFVISTFVQLLSPSSRLGWGGGQRSSRSALVPLQTVAAVVLLIGVGLAVLFGSALTGEVLGAALLVLGTLALTGYVQRLWTLRALTTRQNHETNLSQAGADRCKDLGLLDDRRDIVYAAFGPFVGAGVLISDWSFAIELVPSESLTEGQEVKPLSVPELHAAVKAELRALGAGPDYPGDRLNEIEVKDFIFKPGLRWDSRTAHSSGWQRFSGAGQDDSITGWSNEVDLAANERLRHFVAVRIGCWEEEVVISLFFRVFVKGEQLQVESVGFVLLPIDSRFHVVDTLVPPDRLEEKLVAAWYAFTNMNRTLGQSISEPWRMMGTAWQVRRNEKWQSMMRDQGRPVDHGPRFSVREAAASKVFSHPFQEMDVARLTAMVERRVHTALLNCLRAGGYTLGEYETRQDIQINNGIQISGGTVSGPIAAGSRARAQQSRSPLNQARSGARRQPR
ncbi:hypothetical protein [Streptomyces aureocirculatus]|uniref:hypothetical protein n=1 Tax=Streptomyces aureocirculatus TaxID=67275 RepID=UPI0012FE876B|nr:hypothetical protein [Streptomyces aureocirculatus]